MTTHQSTIEEQELENGISLYVQISGHNRCSISIDHVDYQACVWLTTTELKDFADMINRSIKDSEQWNTDTPRDFYINK
jgi:hypothetical protein